MYKVELGSDRIEESFRAVAASQIDEALAGLDGSDPDRRTIVHEARRRCKKLRGLLRLVRPAFADYHKHNAALRDAAALLSHLRDAEVLQQCVAELAAEVPDPLIAQVADTLRRQPELGDATARIEEFAERLRTLRVATSGWVLKGAGSDILIAGLRHTYRAARRRMREAARSRRATDLHEWRKAAKYHGFHLDLMKRLAPEMLEGELAVVEQLAVLLGRHHDLTILGEQAEETPSRFGDAAELAVLRSTIASRRAAIEDDAFRLGGQTFAERPDALAQRFTAYWSAFR